MTTNKYYIESFHSVFIDDYKQGEGKQVNSYNLSAFIEAQNVTEAIKMYFDKELYFSFDIKHLYNFTYSNLVDNENLEHNEVDINLWKQGKKTLYANYTQLSIYQLNKILSHD
jgi:hypothetical protein